jgi:hypothetical protein
MRAMQPQYRQWTNAGSWSTKTLPHFTQAVVRSVRKRRDARWSMRSGVSSTTFVPRAGFGPFRAIAHALYKSRVLRLPA